MIRWIAQRWAREAGLGKELQNAKNST
uniref:Uncharacterized protein n=1 Tax=Oryza meridionalis TaxID=40149 RepID=A0A0E0EZC3_9ORYZ